MINPNPHGGPDAASASTANSGVADAAELLTSYLRYMPSDFAKWRALFAEDAVMELPYLPRVEAGVDVQKRMDGVEQIASITKRGFLDHLRNFKLEMKNLMWIEGEDAVVGEYSGTAEVVTTGRRYQQEYIAYLRAENGEIAVFREYFNGAAILEAFNPQ